MIYSDTVLERVRTSGIGSNIPTDCAGTLTRRIRGIVIPRAGQGLSETDIHNTWLNNSISISKIDLFDLFHTRKHQHDAATNR